jgi:hypothetical protein
MALLPISHAFGQYLFDEPIYSILFFNFFTADDGMVQRSPSLQQTWQSNALELTAC